MARLLGVQRGAAQPAATLLVWGNAHEQERGAIQGDEES